ncbi:MAG: hypothetical protein GXZ07_11780 [Firmicutes bacterium]|nr:hypothetical protein [Bacillota bacterium]
MVREALTRLKKLFDKENELFSRPLPGREEEEAEAHLREMDATFRELQKLEDGLWQEIVSFAKDKAKERELYRELSFLQELHRKKEENIALCREKLEFTKKEMDRVEIEKRAHFSYKPAVRKRAAAFLDSKI